MWTQFGTLKTLVAFSVISVAATSSTHAATWEFEYRTATEPGFVSACFANIEYNDGIFGVRFAGNTVKYFFSQSSLGLPTNKELGATILAFKNSTFRLRAFSGDDGFETTDFMFLSSVDGNDADIIMALRIAESATIIFPDGTNFTFGLDGSGLAIEQAVNCWKSRHTGPFERTNPFEGVRSKNNPFDLNNL